MHVRIGNVLDDHRDAKFPGSKGLIITSGDESSVPIHKGDRVDGSKMLIILLGYLALIHVPLDDPSIRTSS